MKKPLTRGSTGDSEKSVQFRLNQTGNVYYSFTTQEDKLQEDAKNLFQSVLVLFAAMTRALAQKGKDLFDYDAVGGMIRKSGFFAEVQKYQKTLSIASNSITIDTQVIQQLLPGLTSGSSMEIAKGVLSSLNGEYLASTQNQNQKFGHLLFICEELFGSPMVTVRLFFASKASHTAITSSPCHKTSSTNFEQKQEANTFIFVSPETIAKFAPQFTTSHEEYEKLVGKLAATI